MAAALAEREQLVRGLTIKRQQDLERKKEKLSVLSPAGEPAVRTTRSAGRLDTLDGRTVGELWNGVFKGDVTFPAIRRLLQARHPRLTIVPYTEFPHSHGSDNPAQQRERARTLAALAREKGCDAVISGNGA